MAKTSRRPIRPKAFAKAMLKGETLYAAMKKAGYTEASARRGKAALSKVCATELDNAAIGKLQEMAKLGIAVPAETRAAVMKGALLQNIASQKDSATTSLKLLAQLDGLLDGDGTKVAIGIGLNPNVDNPTILVGGDIGMLQIPPVSSLDNKQKKHIERLLRKGSDRTPEETAELKEAFGPPKGFLELLPELGIDPKEDNDS